MAELFRCSDDDKLMLARIYDLVELCEKRHSFVCSSFLNERQRALISAEILPGPDMRFVYWGGFEQAERKVLCVCSEYDVPESSMLPISCVTFRYRSGSRLTHRDFLGSIMALRIRRETVGDIVIGSDAAQVFVLDSVMPVILSDISKIGSIGVKVSSSEEFFLEKQQSFREITGTVASMRLDCILGLALKVSRTKAAVLIKSNSAEVNYFPCADASAQMSEGDIFSVRGYGKFRIESVSGLSKRGRLHIVMLKYC